MTRKEELLKLLRARLEIVEQKILSYPIWANESAYTELLAATVGLDTQQKINSNN